MFASLEFGAHARLHFLGGILGVGERQNFIGPGMAFADQVRDALDQDGGLAGAGAGHHQHRAMHVLDGFPLAFVGDDLRRSGHGDRTHLPEHIRGLWNGDHSCGASLADQSAPPRGQHDSNPACPSTAVRRARARWQRSPRSRLAGSCRPSEAAIHPDSRNHCSSSSVHPPSGPTASTASDGRRLQNVAQASVHLRIRRAQCAAWPRQPRQDIGLASSFSLTGAAISGGAARRDCSDACRAMRCQRSWRFPAAAARWASVRRAMTGMIRATPISVHFSIAHSMRSNLKMARTRVTCGAGRRSPSLLRRARTQRDRSEIEVIVPAANGVAGSNVEFLPNFGAQNASSDEQHARRPGRRCFRVLRRRSSGGES